LSFLQCYWMLQHLAHHSSKVRDYRGGWSEIYHNIIIVFKLFHNHRCLLFTSGGFYLLSYFLKNNIQVKFQSFFLASCWMFFHNIIVPFALTMMCIIFSRWGTILLGFWANTPILLPYDLSEWFDLAFDQFPVGCSMENPCFLYHISTSYSTSCFHGETWS